MTSPLEWFRRLWHLLNRRQLEADLRADMEAHLEMMDPAKRARFGNQLQLMEQSRDVWGWNWLDNLVRETTTAARSLRRAPGFTATVIFLLAAGFSLTFCTLAVVNAYLVRSMPFPESHRLFHVAYAPIGRPEPPQVATLNWADFSNIIDYVDRSAMTRLYSRDHSELFGLSIPEGSEDVLGAQPVAGRKFTHADYAATGETAILISQSLWKSRYQSSLNAIGQVFRARRSNPAEPDEAFRIVGILPANFHFVRAYSRGPMDFVAPNRATMTSYMVRLRPGVPASAAQQRLAEAVPGLKLESVHDRYVAELRPTLVSIAIAAAMALLAVCSNVGVLALLRAIRRQREVSTRLALGAGRWHIARMLTTEAALLCGAGFLAALALSTLTIRTLAPFIEARLGSSAPGGTEAIAIDPAVLLATGLVATLLVFALSSLTMLARPGRAARSQWLQLSIVTAEVALSLALLIGGAITMRSGLKLLAADLGIRTEGMVRARVALSPRSYPTPSAFMPFFDQLSLRLANGNEPHAFANFIPLYPAPAQTVETEANTSFRAGVLTVSSGYFPMFGVRILRGRGILESDRPGSEPVAVISETLARRLWPDSDALGKRIRTADQPIPDSPLTVWRTVVGVVRDVRQVHSDQDLNDVYLPYAQAPSRYTQVYLRTSMPVDSWLKSLRETAAGIDPLVLVTTDAQTAGSLVTEEERLLAGPKFVMSVLGGFAAFGALLVGLGIYGVTSYAVQQRKREVAIRIALGATNRAVMHLFLRRTLQMLTLGIPLGLLGAHTVTRLLDQPRTTGLFLAAGLAMMLIALLATSWPVRHVLRHKPFQTLREL